MNDDALVRAVALGRISVGATLLVAPTRVLRPWLGADAATYAARTLARTAAGRDVALGIGTLLAARHGAPVRGWLEAGAFADSVDASLSLTALVTGKANRWGSLMALSAGVGSALTCRRLATRGDG
ncbi:MAG: hypothetical protein ABR511_05160 [Acidimicrobiales bacterium]